MLKPTEVLEAHGIPTDERNHAQAAVAALDYDPDAFRVVIADVCGIESAPEVGDDAARFTFMYLVQDIIAGHNTSLPFALERAGRYLDSHPWVLAKPEPTSTYVPKSTVDALGKPKQRKGAKKEKAIAYWNANQDNHETRQEWITALMDNVGLTKGAASTYHHNLKTGKWS